MSDETRTQAPSPPAGGDATLNFPGATAATLESAHAPAGYQLESELGRGGMGVVYKAKQTGLNRTVALKMVLAGSAAGERERIRFLAEAEAVAAIRHPHVVQVYDFGDAGGRPFLAMEFLPGGSLAQKLKANGDPNGTSATRTLLGSGSAASASATKTRITDGNRSPYSPTEAAELVRKLAQAVQAAHEQQIVHRDLKPGNVLFDAAGEPRVTDFGLAKKSGSSDLTGTQAVMGTPAYMAPEQARGGTKFVGPAADIYSLGVMLFECLAGRRPFEADDPIVLLRRVAEETAPSVRSYAPVPADLSRVVEKCLAKEPGERYATASALAEDLRRWLGGEPVTARRASRWDRGMKWVKRNPGTAALLGSLAAALLIGTFVSLAFAFEAHAQKRVADANFEEVKRLAMETDAALQKAMHAEARAVAEKLKAEDALCRNRYEEARAFRLAGQPGWRETSLQRLAESARLRQRERNASEAADVPDLTDIRGEAVAALLRVDASLQRSLPSGVLDRPMLSGNGKLLLSRFNRMQPTMTYGLRGVEPATGREVFAVSESLSQEVGKTPKMETMLILTFNSTMASNSDGSRLLCGHMVASQLLLIDSKTAKAVHPLAVPELDKVRILKFHSQAFSPDDRRVIAWGTLSNDELVLLEWTLSDVKSPAKILGRYALPEKKKVEQAAAEDPVFGGFTPGGDIWFVLAGESKMRVLDSSKSPPTEKTMDHQGLQAVVWHPTEPRYAVLRKEAAGSVLELFDRPSGKRLSSKPAAVPQRNRRGAGMFGGMIGSRLAFSRDGLWLSYFGDRTVHLHDGATGAPVQKFEVGAMDVIQYVDWTADHDLLVKPAMESIQVWRVTAARELQRSLELTAPVQVLAVSPDRRHWIARKSMAAESGKKATPRFVLVEAATGAMTDLPDAELTGEAPRFRPDGKAAVFDSNKSLLELSIPEGRELRRLPPPKVDGYGGWTDAFYLPDGRLAATLSGSLDRKTPAPLGVWDVEGRRFLFQSPDLKVQQFGMQTQVVSPDGRRMLVNPNTPSMPFDLFNQKVQKKPEPWRLIELPDGRPVESVTIESKANDFSVPYILSGDGRRLLMVQISMGENFEMNMGSFSIHVHNLPGGDVILRRPAKPMDEDQLLAAFDDRGGLLVMAPTQETLELWRLDPAPILLARWQPFGGQRIASLGFAGDALHLRAEESNRIDILPLDALNRRLQAMGLGW